MKVITGGQNSVEDRRKKVDADCEYQEFTSLLCQMKSK